MFKLNEDFFFQKIPSIIISLIPFLLITGPFLADLSVVIVSIIFLFYCFKNNDYSFFKNTLFKIFFIFYLYLIFTSLISDNVLYSLKTSITFFRFVIFILAFYFLLCINKNLLKNIFYCLTFCYLVLILDGHFQYLTNHNIFGWPISKNIRVSSFFGNEYILGSYVARFFPIYVSLVIFLKEEILKSKIKYLVFFVFTLSGSLVFISGERVAFLYFITSLIFFGIFLYGFRYLKISILSFFILIIFAFIQTDSKINKRMIDKTLQQIGIENLYNFKNSKRDYIFSKPLDDIHKTGYNIFLDNYLFGIGVKNFRNKCKEYEISEYSCTTHPHNTYIQLLAETGIFGFLFIFSLFLYLFYLVIKLFLFKFFLKKNSFSNFQVGLLCAMLITLFPFVPTGNFFNNWMMTVYSFPVGIWLWSIKKIDKNK